MSAGASHDHRSVGMHAAGSPSLLRDDALMKVRNLTVTFRRGGKILHAVEDVSFDVARAETLGLVGESGSGKTTIGRALLRLLPSADTETSGSVIYDGVELETLPKSAMRAMRRALADDLPGPRVVVQSAPERRGHRRRRA